MNFKKLLSRLTLRPRCLSYENGLYLFLMLWISLGLKILYETVQRELMKECFAEMAVVKRHISMKFHRSNAQEKGKRCSEEKLIGRISVDQSTINNLTLVEEELVQVGNGGWYTPPGCIPYSAVAILVPYRNRYEQLKIFLRHMHKFLQRQQLSYRIFIIEQVSSDPFNRAGLLNIGYELAMKYFSFDCFVLTDVDLLPENDYNSYGCPQSPMHLSVAIDYANYKLLYEKNFGGVTSFKRKDFEDINGMSNLYWGWGDEDDDLYERIMAAGFKLNRPSQQNGTYTQIKKNHFRSSKPNPLRKQLLYYATDRIKYDGLSTLAYDLVELKEEPLYTLGKVVIRKSMYQDVLIKCFKQSI